MSYPTRATARTAVANYVLLVCIAAPATADDLIGANLVLEGGSIVAVERGPFTSASQAVRLEDSYLGETAPRVSTGASGTRLMAGFTPLPEPTLPFLAFVGLGGLTTLARRRRAASHVKATTEKRTCARSRHITPPCAIAKSLLAIGLAVPLPAAAQAPQDMAYQGSLTDSSGLPLVGPIELVLRVYEVPNGGAPLYTETHALVAIDPDDGAFLVRLGLGTTDLDTDGDGEVETNLNDFDATLFLTGPNRYLEVQVGLGAAGEILTPRQTIGSAPYATVAADVVADPTSSIGQTIDAAQTTADAAQAAAVAADNNHTTDTTLDEAQVDAFVADNGYITSDDLDDVVQPAQTEPSTVAHHNTLNAAITDPADTTFGYGATFPRDDQFASIPGSEADNQLGAFYNKDGVNGLPSNQFEHAMDSSWELSWRAAGTGHHTWLEHNIDFWPPDNQTVVQNVAGFDPVVGDEIQFSGGGTGIVLEWDSASDQLRWRQDYGTVDVSANELIAHPATGTANVGATVVSLASANLWRTRQLEWDVYTNQAVWTWRTSPSGSSPAPLRLHNNGAGIGYSGSLGGGIALSVGSHTSNLPTTKMYFQGNLIGGQFGVQPRILDLRYDFSGAGNSFSHSSGLRFLSPVATGTGSTNTTGRRHHIEIFDQVGYGSTSSALYVAAQTCNGCVGGPAVHGNITMRGGNWNDGHYAFGEETSSGDHLWRDQTNEVYRAATDSAPTAEDDGVAFVTGTGATTHGPAFWAISNGGALDTASEVCSAEGVGMTAQSAFDLTAGTIIGATTPVGSGQPFISFCR